MVYDISNAMHVRNAYYVIVVALEWAWDTKNTENVNIVNPLIEISDQVMDEDRDKLDNLKQIEKLPAQKLYKNIDGFNLDNLKQIERIPAQNLYKNIDWFNL